MIAFLAVLFCLSLFVVPGHTYLQLVEPGYTTATSSSTYPGFPASRTVDGDTSQYVSYCSHTADWGQTEAWLRVDLRKTFSIKSVKFWNRNDRGSDSRNTIRLLGYSIRVSIDSSLPPPESSCYTDPGNASLPTVIEKDCKRTARYVWIYQDNTLDGDCPMLAICEVQVFGCELGSYGEDCKKTCSHCKNNVSCGAASGKCNEEGCLLPGYQPPYCQPCSSGKYGENCLMTCSGHCLHDEVCDRFNGTCRACAAGFQGNKCDQKCGYGNYGHSCSEKCGACLNHTDCDHVSGQCSSGCQPGWNHTDKCDQACTDGTFGTHCRYSCSVNCEIGDTCNKQTGHCTRCTPGWIGNFCNESYGNGSYGPMCLSRCGACAEHDVCLHTNGSCPGGCKHGYTGDMCKVQCGIGRYGQNCSEKCGACLNSTDCDHVTGLCSSGCQPGWRRTDKCDQACPDGTFGTHCRYSCSVNCGIGETCNKQTGHCTRCTPGWIGHFCNEKSGKPATDLEKMTLEHLKLDNERLVAETAFLKTREKYYMLKILSEFPIQLQKELEPSMSEKKTIRMKHN